MIDLLHPGIGVALRIGRRRAHLTDWAVPAVLIALGLGLILATGLAFAVAAEDRSETSMLIQDLETYTTCLVDHGADVPRVEAGTDGDFLVFVPGSLAEGKFDQSAWRLAADQCAESAPDVFGGRVGSLSGDWFNTIPEEIFEYLGSVGDVTDVDVLEFDAHPRPRRPGSTPPKGRNVPPPDLERVCQRLAEVEDQPVGPRIDRLRRQCEHLDR
jgi:hypothetical protein